MLTGKRDSYIHHILQEMVLITINWENWCRVFMVTALFRELPFFLLLSFFDKESQLILKNVWYGKCSIVWKNRHYIILRKTVAKLVPETQHHTKGNTDVWVNQDHFNDTPIVTESCINILLYILVLFGHWWFAGQ